MASGGNISESQLNELTEAFSSEGLKGVQRYFEQKVEAWREIELNLAFIGQSGAGKSTLTNTIRDLKAKSPGGAPVGVNATTFVPTCYTDPKNPKLNYWDLPGVGTNGFPRKTYLNDVGFEKYDCFVIVTATRFTLDDLWFAKKIQKRSKRFIFVRTKIGIDFNNTHREDPDKTLDEMKEEIRAEMKKDLGDLYKDENMFLVDSHDKVNENYQFAAFEKRLIEIIPKEKQNALLRSLSATSKSMIHDKVQSLKNDVNFAAYLSAAGGALGGLVLIPGPSATIDIALLNSYSKSYICELGLDKDSLKRRAEIYGVPVYKLEKVVDGKSDIIIREGLEALMKVGFGAVPAAAKALDDEWAVDRSWFVAIQVIGAVAGASVSFCQTRYILNNILDKLEPIAVEVLEIVVSESAKQNMDN